MHREVFRQYDVRGLVDRDLTDEFVEGLGRAIGTALARKKCKTLALGRDCRLSSDRLRDRLVEGMVSTGMNILDIGVVPTPLLYFALHRSKVDGGVMITGSHNPPEYNGFKVAVGKSTIYGAEIQKLADLMEKRDYRRGRGEVSQQDVIPAYMDTVTEGLELTGRELTVAVDAGNGTGGVVAVPILERLGVKVRSLYCEMDGRFPNHHPDPTILENLKDLIREVREHKLPAGIAFDGDADRLGVVDDLGNIVWGDKLMILFSRAILARRPGTTIIGEVKCSKTMYDDIAAHGGNAIMWKTGHSLIKAKMKESGAVLAGEMSGHLFFADRYFGYDDAIYAACRLVEILDGTGQRITELLADVPETVATPEIRVDCPEERKFEVVQQLTDYFRSKYQVVDVDGARILYPDGWGLVRASNTQPALVLRFEASTEERMNRIRSEVERALHEVGGL